MSFSIPLHSPAYPFYTGHAVGEPGPGMTVGLGGRDYLIDLREYRHNGLKTFREASVDTGVPDDQLFNTEGSWWRYKISFHHGEGQAVADLEQSADAARYFAGRGIDPWTKYQACLLPATELVHAAAAGDIFMTSTATHVYHSDGNAVYRSADLSTWDAVTGMAAESVVAMTSDGVSAYIATTDHIYRVDVAGLGATSVTSATPVNDFASVAFVANRLLASDGNLLVEVKAATLDTIFTHYQPAFRWRVIFQVGSRIYVGGYSGNRSELYSLTTTDVGALALSAEAASFFAGELLRTALSYGGSVILGTSKGVRFATLGGDGTLQYGPLIDAPGDVECLAAEGRFVWFGWENFPDEGTGLGRLALDEFVNTLLPAYASDIFTDDANDSPCAAVRFGERTLFAVPSEGIYVSHQSEYVTEGYIDTGELYLGTVEDKSITEVRARTMMLAAGESIQLVLTDAESEDVIASGSASTAGEFGVAVNADGEIVNHAELRIWLRGPGISMPCLRHWRARAYPVAPSMEEWIVPLIIHSRVVLGEGQGEQRSYDVWSEIVQIKDWWTSKQVITYTEGEHAFRVRVDNFEVSPASWRDGSDWFEITVKVRLLSV